MHPPDPSWRILFLPNAKRHNSQAEMRAIRPSLSICSFGQDRPSLWGPILEPEDAGEQLENFQDRLDDEDAAVAADAAEVQKPSAAKRLARFDSDSSDEGAPNAIANSIDGRATQNSSDCGYVMGKRCVTAPLWATFNAIAAYPPAYPLSNLSNHSCVVCGARSRSDGAYRRDGRDARSLDDQLCRARCDLLGRVAGSRCTARRSRRASGSSCRWLGMCTPVWRPWLGPCWQECPLTMRGTPCAT